MQGPHVTKAACDGQPRGGRKQSRAGDLTLLDGVADDYVESWLGRGGADATGDAVVEVKPGVVHRQQRVLLGWHAAKCGEIVRVVDTQVRVRLNQPGHECHAAFAVMYFRAVTIECFAIARDGGDLVALHPNLAGERFPAGAVEHVDVYKQVLAHC